MWSEMNKIIMQTTQKKVLSMCFFKWQQILITKYNLKQEKEEALFLLIHY